MIGYKNVNHANNIDLISGASDGALLRLLETEFPEAEIVLWPRLGGSENRHAAVIVKDRSVMLFVKFYSNKDKYKTERIALAAIGERYTWPILPISGSDAGEPAWQSFPYVEVKAIDEATFPFYDWGVRLAELHSCEPPGLPRSQRAIDVVATRLELLGELSDPVAIRSAQHADTIWRRARAIVGDDAKRHEATPRLISNDFGFRNTFVRPDGQLALIDFEWATVGDPHWELGKAWDRELVSAGDRDIFLSGYRATIEDHSHWPDPATLWVTRFVACLAAIPYALRVNDQQFLDHSVATMNKLEWEL